MKKVEVVDGRFKKVILRDEALGAAQRMTKTYQIDRQGMSD